MEIEHDESDELIANREMHAEMWEEYELRGKRRCLLDLMEQTCRVIKLRLSKALGLGCTEVYTYIVDTACTKGRVIVLVVSKVFDTMDPLESEEYVQALVGSDLYKWKQFRFTFVPKSPRELLSGILPEGFVQEWA